MKKIFILSVLLFGLFSCNNNAQKINTPENKKVSENNKVVKNNAGNQKIKVVTSIIPLASIVNYIGGDYVSVGNIVGAGVEPHEFSLSIPGMTKIKKSDLVVSIGLENMDGFLDKAIVGKDYLKLSTGVKLVDLAEEDKEDGDDNHGIEKNPHIWNSFTDAEVIAKKIAKKLTKLQPAHKDVFEKNLLSFDKKLDDLKAKFEEKVKGKKQTHFIIFHNAYSYLFKDLGIDEKNKVVFRENVLAEPNSVQMKSIIDKIKKYNIKVAFVEPQYTNSTLSKIAKEYDIQIATLDPLGEDISGEGFITNMKNNLDSLYKIYE